LQSILKVDPVNLYNKLNSYTITSTEAEQLFLFVQNFPDKFINRGLSIDEIKKASCKALGRIENRNIRMWLVEIEEL